MAVLSDNIRFLDHTQIDKSKYDGCIKDSVNSLIYARSFYLDNISPNWNAIVAEDYSWVMPITWKKKLGVKYLYQPAFTQQLGVFAKDQQSVPLPEILKELEKRYSFWQIQLNYLNTVKVPDKKLTYSACTNFIIDLKPSYETICNNYHKDLARNLNRARKFNLHYILTDDYNKAIEEYISTYGNRIKHLTNIDYTRFRSICKIAFNDGMIQCRKVVDDSNELLSIALFFIDEKRIYNIMNTTTMKGRKVEANHFLIDSVLKEFAGSGLIFDFEGSDLGGIKNFYQNFNPINQPYSRLTFNNLPWPIKLLK